VNIGRDNYDKFNSTDYLQFENQKIAMPMMFMNQVNILDLKEGNNKAITTKKNHPSWDNIKNKENSELNVYYINARITHDYIFALYLDQPILEWQNTPKKMSVHVFNWDGVFRYELLLDEYLMCIAIDESLKIMYGVTYEEELVTYDISKIIESGVSQ